MGIGTDGVDWDRQGGLGQTGKIELKPTKVKRSECPKSNNHYKAVYLGKAVPSKPKKFKKNRGWSHFVALENLFPMVIWFLIFKFFLTKLLPTKVTRSECPKSN